MRLPLPVAILLLGAAGASTVAPPGDPTGAVGRAELPATHTVQIRDFAFSPARLDVAPGDTVIWVNHDAAPHTATDSLGGWHSGELASKGSWTWVAADAGRFPYLCAYHPSMRGEVRVRADRNGPDAGRGAPDGRRP